MQDIPKFLDRRTGEPTDYSKLGKSVGAAQPKLFIPKHVDNSPGKRDTARLLKLGYPASSIKGYGPITVAFILERGQQYDAGQQILNDRVDEVVQLIHVNK